MRYLDISKTRFKALPKSIGKLYNLQTLRATKCALKEFPKELQNLINLRHIYFDEDIKFPQGIGRLTCLRTLPYFSVGNEIGRQIEELAGLKQLKGELIVCNLEHVKNGEEAKKAKLEDKTKVYHLKFKWTADRSTIDNNEEEDVLEGLRPYPELKCLSIENFMGVKFPSWMMSGSSLPLNNLKRLCIFNCKKLRHLPYGLDTLPLLGELGIKGCDSLELIPIEQGMTSLRELEIEDCGQLSHLPSGLKNCTSLQKLSIQSCNGLSGPLSLWASLVKVSLYNCNGLSGPLSVWASLVELDIRRCNNLTSIEMKGSGSLTASLQKLRIRNCRELTSLPALPQQCPSLQYLYIEECPKLASFCAQSSRIDEEECISLHSTSDLRTITSLRPLHTSDLRTITSLGQLYIVNCERLESWVSSLQFPISLEYLVIDGIPNLEILPSLDHLHSLRVLSIVSWRNLKYLPTGLQWPTGLETLIIGGFWGELDSFPDFEVGSLMHLRTLVLHGWPKLKSLPQQIQHLTSVTHLMIFSIEGVETLPEWLGSLTSLIFLFIRDCKNLMNLPSVQAMQRLTKLQILLIRGCHPLLEERCRRDSGTDWPKISHIPDLRSKFLKLLKSNYRRYKFIACVH